MISEIAEEMDHHPTYQFIGETDLSIELITHDEKKITEKDVELARKINQCFKAYKKN
jgi:pterin-4a-carbinolamine dehydratase